MRHFGCVILLALAAALSGCGGGSNDAGTLNGNWSAALSNTDGTPAFTFNTTLNQSSNSSSLTVTNFTFSTTGGCFTGDTTQSGAFAFSGNFNGNVTGTFSMNISTVFPTPPNNVLTLQGTVNGGTIAGNWTLTGLTGCTGSGTFSMTQM